MKPRLPNIWRTLAILAAVLFGGPALAAGTVSASGAFGPTGTTLQAAYQREAFNLDPFLPLSVYTVTTARVAFPAGAPARIDVTAGAGVTYNAPSGLFLDLRADYRLVYSSDPRVPPHGLEVSFALIIPVK